MMPCDQDVSRKRFQRSTSLENLDGCNIEHQQQALLDLSLSKLHQEQAQQIEPCLLKLVLISNVVRALQHQQGDNFTYPLLLIADQTDDMYPFAKILPIKGNAMEGHSKFSGSESDIIKSGSETNSNFECMDTSLTPLDLKGIDPLLYDFDACSSPMLQNPIKETEDDPSVLLDEIVDMLIET